MDGWISCDGYALQLRDGKVVVRSASGRELASIPKELRRHEAVLTLMEAATALDQHAISCRENVERWMLRSLTVPRAALVAVWNDDAWRKAAENLLVAADGVTGILRAATTRGIGMVTLDGETHWSAVDAVAVPHPILVGELPAWRELLAGLGATQGVEQVFRETFARPGDVGASKSVDSFANGHFAMLVSVANEARKRGYRVSAGSAVCTVWTEGGMGEARYWIGDGESTLQTSTAGLIWVDAQQRQLRVIDVHPVAYSEGVRMASALYAKRDLSMGAADDDV